MRAFLPWLLYGVIIFFPLVTKAAGPAELQLAAADLFHHEYRQDLRDALARADRLVSSSSGSELQMAYIQQARIHRLRGEFTAARASLQKSLDTKLGFPQARILFVVESNLLRIEQATMPGWIAIEPNTDLDCVGLSYEIDYNSYKKIIEKAQQEIGTSLWSYLLSSIDYIDIVKAPYIALAVSTKHVHVRFSQYNNLAEKQCANCGLSDVISAVNGFDVTTVLIPEVVRGRRLRALMPMLQRAWPRQRGEQPVEPASWRAYVHQVFAAVEVERGRQQEHDELRRLMSCELSFVRMIADPTLRGLTALSCFDAYHFPGSSMEEIGLIIEQPDKGLAAWPERLARTFLHDGQGVHISPSKWPQTGIEPDNLMSLASAAGGADAEKYFAIAREAFAKAVHARGTTRLQLSAAAAKLKLLLTAPTASAKPEWRSQLDSLRADLLRIERSALELGDHRLEATAQSLTILVESLLWSRLRAQQATTRLAESSNARADYGAALSAARLAAAVGMLQTQRHYDISAADILFESAVTLYTSCGALLESGQVFLRWSEALRSVGAIESAADTLRRGTHVVSRSSCEDPTTLPFKLSVQGEILLYHVTTDYLLQDGESLSWVSRQLLNNFRRTLACLQSALQPTAKSTTADAEQVPAQKAEGTIRCEGSGTSLLRFNLMSFPTISSFTEVFAKNLTLAQKPPQEQEVSKPGPREPEFTRKKIEDLLSIGRQFSPKDGPLSGFADAEYERSLTRLTNAFRQDPAWRQELLARVKKECTVAQAPMPLRECGRAVNNSIDVAARLCGRMSPGVRSAYVDYAGALELLDGLSVQASGDWIGMTPEPWHMYSLYAEIYSGLGRHKEALAVARRAVEAQEARRDAVLDERLRVAFLDSRSAGWYFGTAIDVAAKAQDAGTTIEFIERGKARVLQETILLGSNASLHQAYNSSVSLWLLKRIYSEKDCVRRPSRDCVMLQKEIHTAEQNADPLVQHVQVRKLQDALAAAFNIPALTTRLREGELLLDYYVTDESLVTVVLRPGHPASVVRQPLSRHTLRSYVKRLITDLADGIVTKKEDERWLSQLLLERPLAGIDLMGVRSLLLIPHAELHSIPWAYLPGVSRPGRRLIEDFNLKVLPFAGLLLRRAEHESLRPRDTVRILADRSALEYADLEVARVSSVYRHAAAENAGWPELQEVLATKGVVHIIAHGRSTNRASAKDATGGYSLLNLSSGPVRVMDILTMPNAVRADVIVLASCMLGLGRSSSGDEQVGIARALLARGASSVLGALWRLPEAGPTVVLMESLHRGLVQGAATADALAAAQRQAIRQGVMPLYWAALVATGL